VGLAAPRQQSQVTAPLDVGPEIGIAIPVPINYRIRDAARWLIPFLTSSTMKTQGAKRGRPPGTSPYAAEDRAALERMYELWKRDKRVSAAAKAVTKEMKLRPSPAQATERLRRKFGPFREEREKASRSTRPDPQSANIPSLKIAGQARRVHEFLRTPEGKAIKEKARLVSENKRSILEGAKLARRIRKPKI